MWTHALGVALTVSLTAAQCSLETASSPAPTKPADDPFWRAPTDFASRAQGRAVDCRNVNWNSVDGASKYYQYSYRTVNSNGTSVVAVATILIPSSRSGPYSELLSYQVPYDSSTSFCGPSFAFQTGSGSKTSNTYQITNNFANTDQAHSQALKAGIPVAISDYEGRFASFPVGVTEGTATLNGIIAVVQDSGLFQSTPSVALWAYSGGAFATEFALELAGSMRLPFTVIGASLGGLTPNIRNVFSLVNGAENDPRNPAGVVYPALIPYAGLGISNENTTVNTWIQRNLKTSSEPGAPDQASYKDRFNKAASDECNQGTGGDFVNSNFNHWFNGLPASGQLVDVREISDTLNIYGIMGQTGTSNGVTRTVPKYPLYFYKGTKDEVSAIQDTTALQQKYCGPSNTGASITYVQLKDLTHAQAQTSGLLGAWSYLSDRFASKTTTGCPAPTME